MTTPGIEFRNLMDSWDYELRLRRLREMEEDEDMSFFFKKGTQVFGGPEESRMTFARLKVPDEDSDKAWALDATFIGHDLNKKADGDNRSMRLFTKKDLNQIKVLSREDAMKEVKNEFAL
jgi:hypothetical protein